jgi:hypothetical protein
MPDTRQGETIMQKIDFLQYEALKLQHQLAVDEMLVAIDKVNDLKSQIFKIECERDKNL